MNVLLLSSSISNLGGGVTEVKRRLAQSLAANNGVQVQVMALEDAQTNRDLKLWQPLQPQAFKTVGPKAIGYSPKLLNAVKKSSADVIHLHGIWQYPSYAALKGGKPVITTVHGMLDKWAINNSKYKKQVARWLYEQAALNKAACLQAFNAQEYEDIRGLGLKNPVCMVPNGVDLPQNVAEIKAQSPVWKALIPEGKKVMLYLGRIHPKKGLTNLVKAWKVAVEAAPAAMKDWALAIAGWDQGGYETELKQLASTLQLQNEVFFLGPQFGVDKQKAFAHAHAFILPSFSEGLPMVVLEAWSYNLPVLITKHCNLPEGVAHGAAIEIKPEEKSVAEGVIQAATMQPYALTAMGTAGFSLVQTRFVWSNVAQSLLDVYRWIDHKGPMPGNVILE